MPPLSVLVDGQRGATAIAGVSEVTINVGGTFGGETKLRYQADYGDGQSSTQGVAKHVYANAGTFHLTVTATGASGRQANTAQDVSVSSVNGAWFQFGVNDAIHQFEGYSFLMGVSGPGRYNPNAAYAVGATSWRATRSL